MSRSVVITGVSSGIGLATAKVLIDSGFRVFGSVRKQSDADRLSGELGDSFTPLLFDITDEDAANRAASVVGDELAGRPLTGLVNNAGVAVAGPLLELPIADFRRQIDVNLTGAVIVTKAFAPLLGAVSGFTGTPGRIVNVSSVSGKFAPPFMGPYAASKFALEGLSDSLRRELMIFGVDVIVIAPGMVATPIWEKAEDQDVSVFAGSPYGQSLRAMRELALKGGRSGLDPERIAHVIEHALTVKAPKARYEVRNDRAMGLVTSLLPTRVADQIVARKLNLRRES